MDWKTLQGYEEKYAKVTIKSHKTFDGKVIEVLYGAVDEKGQPTLAVEGHEDGHGRWYGIESNGEYTMLVWQKPASQGGDIEYGTEFKENAVEELEKDVRHKQDLCRQVETLNAGTSEEEIEAIKKEWEAIPDWKTAKEQEYKTWFEASLEKLKMRKEKAVQNASLKETLVQKAEELKNSTAWKDTQEAFRQLQEQWQDIGHAGEKENTLWESFKKARKEFNKSRKEYFANLDTVRGEAKLKKEELIKLVQEAVEKNVNYNALSSKMDEWMNDWKALGSAGREWDDQLWEAFNGARQKFFAERKEFFKKRNEEFSASLAKKNALIEQAKEIVASGNLDKENTEKMKSLDVAWREAGYSGRKDNDRIWEEFKAVKEQFWDAKHGANQQRFQDILAHKEELTESLRKEINQLQEDVFQVDDYEEVHEMERQISRKKAMLEQIKDDIEDLKNKIN
ncbi:DUF349 domain-containing protein [Bulleidia sp. zg-1006]|uniref:DUF349 domain-containing protein n=1 Tax=Bulleidia sp. zg-1006 TaxID=2806552 RepID=UPI0019394F43|nr:DUF349 domain-containing protein [Bulleidia sp. zg-1006]QRG86577.1 DUF349 domain-containing protein [Bulleidia sp. zg-1006]